MGNHNSGNSNNRPSSSRIAGARLGNSNSNHSNNGRVDCQELSDLKAKVRATLQHLLQQVPVRLGHLADGREDQDKQAWDQGLRSPRLEGSSMNGCTKQQGEGSGREQRNSQSTCTAAQKFTSTGTSVSTTGREGASAKGAWQGVQAGEEEEEEAEEEAGLQAALVDLAASAVGAVQLLGACAPVVTAACMQKQLHLGGEQQVNCERKQQPRPSQHAMVLEAVEVKNTVPFSQAAHKPGAQGGTKVCCHIVLVYGSSQEATASLALVLPASGRNNYMLGCPSRRPLALIFG
eukprot:1143137-Pelagomonas_calceolata.AAC.3